MVFLFSIFAQWFSRGFFLKTFFQQEESLFLIVAFLGAIALSSPIQGHMSDLTSRKKVILLGLSFTISSLLIVLLAPHMNLIKLPVVLGIAAIVNGVFGNVFPAAAAAFSERKGGLAQSTTRSFLCRYLGMGFGFILPLPQTLKLVFCIALAVVAFLWVIFEVEDREVASEEQ